MKKIIPSIMLMLAMALTVSPAFSQVMTFQNGQIGTGNVVGAGSTSCAQSANGNVIVTGVGGFNVPATVVAGSVTGLRVSLNHAYLFNNADTTTIVLPDSTAANVGQSVLVSNTVASTGVVITYQTIANVQTISGSVGVGDKAGATFTGSGLTTSPTSIQYSEVTGDTAITSATGLVAAVNSNAVMQAAGITASNAGGTSAVITYLGLPAIATPGTAVLTADGATTTCTVSAAPLVNNAAATTGTLTGVTSSLIADGNGNWIYK